MVCKKCGKEIADNSKFCPFCGVKIEETAASEVPETETPAVETPAVETPAAETPAAETPKAETPAEPVPTTVDPGEAVKAGGKKFVEAFRKIPAKVWGICLAVIVAIVVVCNIVSCAGSKSPFITTIAKEQIIDVSDNFLLTGSGKKLELDADISAYELNYNNTVVAVLDEENILWAANTKKITMIAEDVRSFVISFYGDTIVYVRKDGDGYAVFSYNVSKKKSTKIYDDNGKNIVVSPNGKMIAFTNNDGNLLVSRKGKTAKKEISEAVPCAVSDDGKHVFCVKNGKLCDGDDKLCETSELYSYSYIYFNVHCNEVLFSADGSTYYYSTKFDEPVKIKGSTLNGVATCEETASMVHKTSGLGYVKVCGVKTFNNNVLEIGGSMYYISKKGENVDRIISAYSKYIMSEDGQSIVYTESGSIYKVANVKKGGEAKKLGNDLEARALFADGSLKNIYYLNSDGELRYLKSGKGVLISDDVYSSTVVYDKGVKRIVYVNEDWEVYTASATKKSRKRLDLGDKAAGQLYKEGKDVYIVCSDEDDTVYIYKITSAKKVKKLGSIE